MQYNWLAFYQWEQEREKTPGTYEHEDKPRIKRKKNNKTITTATTRMKNVTNERTPHEFELK